MANTPFDSEVKQLVKKLHDDDHLSIAEIYRRLDEAGYILPNKRSLYNWIDRQPDKRTVKVGRIISYTVRSKAVAEFLSTQDNWTAVHNAILEWYLQMVKREERHERAKARKAARINN